MKWDDIFLLVLLFIDLLQRRPGNSAPVPFGNMENQKLNNKRIKDSFVWIVCFVLFSWTKGKRHANNRSQERQYVKLSFALSVKEARGGRCEKYRFIKIKQHKEVISVSLQKSQEIYLILRSIISRSLPIYCLIIHFLKSLKRYLVSLTNRISISDLRISVCCRWE